MMYYAARALSALGHEEEAKERFTSFINYAKTHMEDTVKIDYFAVSLPDFLIFEADLDKKDKIHCLYMAALGYLGRNEYETAKKYARQGLELDSNHFGFLDILKEKHAL